MADPRAKRHIDRYRARQGARGVWMQTWEDLAQLMLPQRMGFAASTVPGERRTDDLYDGTPMQAARGLANAMGGMLRPDGQQWFFLKAVDDDNRLDDEAKDWLADSEDRMREAFADPKARFRQATGEADLDLVVFGTSVIFEGEGKRLNHLLFQSVHLKDACPYFDDEGTASGLYRCRTLKVEQAMDAFGLENLSDRTKALVRREKFEESVEFLHAVTPREEGRVNAFLSRNFPFSDTWIEVAAQHIVKDGGFREFPFIVPRWDTSSGEDYGRSPGMIALPDASTLQAMGETMLIAGQRAADPPLLTPADGAFHEINTVPGGLAYYDADLARTVGRIPIAPLETSAKMPLTREMQQDMRDQVFRAFLRNVLNLPVDGPDMTATEVMQRKEEFLREIGPVFGRLESDYTAPMIERGFKIMLRAGAFLPIPESLAGRKVRFEYESPVKRIRQQVEAAAARLWVLERAELAKVDPSAMDIVDIDEYGRFSAEAANLPNKLVRGQDQIAAIRAQRQKATEMAQQVTLAQQGADAMKKAGETPGLRQVLESAGNGGNAAPAGQQAAA